MGRNPESRFESTYKELKHTQHDSAEPLGFRFESTYKELKLERTSTSTAFRHRFESTYKELKLAECSEKLQKELIVLSLPIRN